MRTTPAVTCVSVLSIGNVWCNTHVCIGTTGAASALVTDVTLGRFQQNTTASARRFVLYTSHFGGGRNTLLFGVTNRSGNWSLAHNAVISLL